MKRNYTGCAICDSTWGDTWAEVDGERMFFCCELCVVQFRGLVERIKATTGWLAIDAIAIEGDRRGRRVEARHGGATFRAFVAFNAEGRVREFRAEADPPDTSANPTRSGGR